MNQNKTTSREPLFHVVKRPERSGRQMLLFRLGAVALSILAGGLFILAIGYNPIEIYGTILNGAFRSKIAVQSTIKITIPLCISALGATLAFKMKFWNIGGEGQIIMGGVFATYFALFHADWPHLPLMIVCFLAGLIGGGLWGLIPALFKVKWNTNETLLTLMLNYIALYIISWLQNGPWRDPTANGFPKIAAFAKNAVLGKVLGVQAGWIVMLVLTVLVFVLGLCLAQEVMEEESLWMGLRQAASVVVPVACVVLAFLWAVMTNRGYSNMQYQYEETYADLVRLADRIEQCEGYTPDMKLWLSDNEWPVTEDRTLGDLTGLSGMGGMKLFDWLHYRNDFMYLFGLKFEQCDQEEYRAIRETQEFQEMPNWPATGSVKVINGVMVVKTDHEHVD